MVTLHIEGEWEERLERLSSLDGTPKEQIASRLLRTGLEHELAEMEAQVIALADEARSSGEVRELTDADWAEIMSAKLEDADPDSLAVPPGWQPKRR